MTCEGSTEKRAEAVGFIRKGLKWHKGKGVVAKGSLKHVRQKKGGYVYERRLGDKQVVVMMNGNDAPKTMNMEQTAEILPYGTTLTDMLTGKKVTITPEMTFAPRELYILEN